MALSDIVPINRKEEFLQAIADKSGAPVPVTRIEEFLKRISETPGLPAVTSDDNNDVLAVVDGEWAKSPAPSSLPPYTSADKGKGLFLAEDAEHTETVVIVPEQTVTVTGAGPSTWVTVELTGVDFGKLSDGDTVSVSMGGQATDMEYEENGASGEGLYLNGRLFIDSTYLHSNKNGEVTVSATASVPSVEPKWEAARGAISFFPVTATATTHTAGITAGEMQDLLKSGKIPTGIASYNGEPVNTYMIAGVSAGKAGYNVVVIGAFDTITVNDLTDYPVLWSL